MLQKLSHKETLTSLQNGSPYLLKKKKKQGHNICKTQEHSHVAKI